jgi:hypothetical protein
MDGLLYCLPRSVVSWLTTFILLELCGNHLEGRGSARRILKRDTIGNGLTSTSFARRHKRLQHEYASRRVFNLVEVFNLVDSLAYCVCLEVLFSFSTVVARSAYNACIRIILVLFLTGRTI